MPTLRKLRCASTRMRALIAQHATTMTAPTTDATMTAVTTTAVTIVTAIVIGQKDPGLVKIAAAGQTTSLLPSMNLSLSATDKQYKKILDGPCPLHKNTKHKMKDCLGLAKEFQDKKLDDDTNDGAR